MTKKNNPLTQLWRWVADQVAQDVPTDIALCEYDCRKGQCILEEWETCDRRLHKAAGELMPAADQNLGKEQSETGSPKVETTSVQTAASALDNEE